MKEFSVTVSSGEGSEKHNHDLAYRKKLAHTHDTNRKTVIELVPYKNYRDAINELYKPYIDAYNEERKKAKEEAWERYKNGQRKSKPKAKDYKLRGYDVYATYFPEGKQKTVYNKVKGRYEKVHPYRSMIVGLGKASDKEVISREEALKVFKDFLKRFEKDFPNLHIIGATVHLDESGFYHMHVDYVPLYEKIGKTKGLAVGNSIENALKSMGYVPEKSIINGKDKPPLLFNALRNRMYGEMEEAMNENGLAMQYFVNEKANRSPSERVELSAWQQEQDRLKNAQKAKNRALDDIGTKSPELMVLHAKTLETQMECVKTNLLGNVKVQSNLWLSLLEAIRQLRAMITKLADELKKAKEKNAPLERENNMLKDKLKSINVSTLEEENANLKAENNKLYNSLDNVKMRNRDYKSQNEKLKNENRELKKQLDPRKDKVKSRDFGDR